MAFVSGKVLWPDNHRICPGHHRYTHVLKTREQEPVLSSNDSTRSCHIFFEGVYNLEPWQTVYFRRCLTQSLALDEIFTKLNTKISTAFQTGSYTERTFFERVSKAYEDVYSNLTTAKELLTLDSAELSMEQLNYKWFKWTSSWIGRNHCLKPI